MERWRLQYCPWTFSSIKCFFLFAIFLQNLQTRFNKQSGGWEKWGRGSRPGSRLPCWEWVGVLQYKGFSSAYLLTRHTAKFRTNNEFKCSHCPASFKLKKSLKNHVASVHNIHSILCRYCDKRFKVKRFLSDHIRTVNPDEFSKTCRDQHSKMDEQRKHHCTQCNASFKTNEILNRHIKTVHAPRNLPCPHCKMMFKEKKTLIGHIKSLYSSTISTEQRGKSPELINNPSHYLWHL